VKRQTIQAFTLVLALSASLSAGPHDHAAPQPPPAAGGSSVVDVPPVDVGASTLAERQRAEESTRGKLGIFHDFRFTDRVGESGITFVHQIVDDAGKTYKPAHYDHGNGIAVADVDGDGKYDVYFTNQLGGNELWKNLGNGRFQNVTAQAGVGLADRVSVSASFADVDNDGDQDLYVTTVRMGNALFQNDGKGRFKDVTQASGLGHVGHSSGAVFFDYDRDGRLDLFLVNVGKYTSEARGRGGAYVAYEDAFRGHLKPERTERSILYRNLGGTRFEDVSEKTGLVDTSWSGDATVADFNRDGWPDLYVLNMQGDNHYWENQGGKTFVDKTARLFPKTPWGAMGVEAFDHDNDGDQDLLLTDMHSDMIGDVDPRDEKLKNKPTPESREYLGEIDNNIFGNAFYENQGDGTFRERSDELNLENYWPWGLSVGDLNADGWEDVFIASSMNFPFRYGVNSLLLNDKGKGFRDAAFLLGVEPRRGGATRKPWFTLDCSGEDRAHAFCAGRTGRFTVTGTLGTRSSALFDVDDDGDLDIVTNEFNSEPQVFLSDLSTRRKVNHLEVRLTGTRSNRDGVGATVKVTAGPLVLTQVMDGKSGYLSHSRLPLYFGLGDAAQVDKVEVTWPSGKTQTLQGPVAINRMMEIKEEG
jgi:enediyne biosynthesis protein E4